MIARPPVILSPSVPRFITAGDSFDLIVKISNQDAPDGEWNLEVVLPEGITHNGSSSIKTKGYLKQGEEVIKTFTLGSSSELFKALTAKLTLTIADERIEESVFITTRPITKPTRHVKYYPLTNGIVTIPDPAKDWHDGADVSYEALSSGICGLKEAEKWLSEYDYDCTEQITSKAFPYLIAEDLLKLGVVSEDYKKQDKAKAMMTYADILQRLCNNGEFSMWPRWNQPWGYGTVFADHFIFEAEKRKLIEVDNAIRNALIHILSVYAQDARSEFAFIRAYATYVLAVAGEKSFITPARNIISRQGNDFNSFIAAMALFKGGYALEAMQALEKCKDSLLQSTSLQEVGMGLYMISQTGIQDLSSYVPLLYKIDNTIGDGGTWDTTIGNCWSLLGKGAFLARITNGEPNAKNIVPEITSDAANSSVTISAQTAIYAKVDIVGTPKVSLAHEKPVKVEVEYLDAYGKKVSKVQKGDLITVVVNVATPSIMDNAVLASLVPGGFEIEDSSLLTRSTVSAYKVSNIYNDYGHKEIRDDRFLWFGSLPKSNQNRPFTTFSYYIRAVIPGQYRIPVTGIEKMYDPNFSGETLQSDEVIVIE